VVALNRRGISRRLVGRVRQLLRSASLRDCLHLSNGVSLTEFGEPDKDIFFGYYDVTPFGPGDRTLLAMRRPAEPVAQAAGTPVELGVYRIGDPAPRFRRFGLSTAWCWQQGCRLQWWRDGTDGRVIYNRTDHGRHEAVIQSVETGEILSVFERPVYSVAADGASAVTLNFARLQHMRPGYGYGDLDDPFESEAAPREDGLWQVDLVTGGNRLLLSLAEIAAFQPESSMQGAKHYFNHLLWSPDGSRFFFLHLWQAPQGRRYSRAFVWERATRKFVFLGAKDHFSHHWWISEDRLLAYSTHHDTGRHYHLYRLAEGARDVVAPDLLLEDGHPSTSPLDASLLLTDTYPDPAGDQHLLLYDGRGDRLLRVGDFYSPPAFRGEVRCDLHPRWSRRGTLVCVDSAHRGQRRLCLLDIEELLRANDHLSPPAAPS